VDIGQIESRAASLVAWLRKMNVQTEVAEGRSKIGGGSLPEETLPTRLVAIRVAAPQELAQRLRQGSPPVIGRIEKDAFLLDLRTVPTTEEAGLRQALGAAL
jgi:L-seryl-tRNA(Ser) seleniumtransferase